MKNCKRPLMMNQERDFYQTPTDGSEGEIQRCCRFVKRLKTMDDQRVFHQFVDSMKSYESRSLSYTDLKNRVFFILGTHEGLVGEFHQLLSAMYEGFDKSKKIRAEWRQVSPSYYIIPEAEQGSSSSSDEGFLNDTCVAVGHEFDPNKVAKRKTRMDYLEEELFEEDMLLETLTSVIRFGEDVSCEKPPLRFDKFIERYYGDAKKVPQIFKIDPKLAVQGILHGLQSMEKEIRKKKQIRQSKNKSRVPRKK